MGVTRQAAQKRFVPKESATSTRARASGYTDRARSAVMAADNAAKAVGDAEGLPEHLVLGLITERESLSAKAIAAQGVTLDAIRAAATAALPPAAAEVPELVPYGPAAKKVLELTFREALRLGHNYIGTEHILLALLEHEHGEGVLSGLGLGKEATERYVVDALAEYIRITGGKTEEETGQTGAAGSAAAEG
ncbi:hypothetical protein SVIOM342S_04468 [Streptomyces violaceorubidus]